MQSQSTRTPYTLPTDEYKTPASDLQQRFLLILLHTTTATNNCHQGLEFTIHPLHQQHPTGLWVRAGNKNRQKTALQGPQLSTKHDVVAYLVESASRKWPYLLSPKNSSARTATVDKARCGCVPREDSQSQMAIFSCRQKNSSARTATVDKARWSCVPRGTSK